MPADYDVLSSEQTSVVLSPTQVLEATRIGIVTKPSGVQLSINVPAKGVTAQQASTTLQQYALLVEAAMRLEGVVAGRGEQDVDASGLLADYVVFTVELPPDPATFRGAIGKDVRVLTRNLSAPTAFAKYVADPVSAALAFLQGIAEG